MLGDIKTAFFCPLHRSTYLSSKQFAGCTRSKSTNALPQPWFSCKHCFLRTSSEADGVFRQGGFCRACSVKHVSGSKHCRPYRVSACVSGAVCPGPSGIDLNPSAPLTSGGQKGEPISIDDSDEDLENMDILDGIYDSPKSSDGGGPGLKAMFRSEKDLPFRNLSHCLICGLHLCSSTNTLTKHLREHSIQIQGEFGEREWDTIFGLRAENRVRVRACAEHVNGTFE
eukprot:805972_1